MKTKDLNITIAGGGATHTPGIAQALLSSIKRLPFTSLTLYDIDEKRNDDMYVIVKYLLKKNKISTVSLRQTTDPKVAFTGVDFVFSQIRVGNMKMREKDEKIPLKYGLIGQETCGLCSYPSIWYINF